MKKFSSFGIKPDIKTFMGEKIKIDRIINREIIVSDYKIEPSNFEGDRLTLQIEVSGDHRIVFTGSKILTNLIKQIPKSEFPFSTTIVKDRECYEFT